MKQFVDRLSFLVMDVDGTLTDGGLRISDSGELFKVFDAKDGYALKATLPRLGIVPVIITARYSPLLEIRCAELGISEVYQGAHDKLAALEDVLKSYSIANDNTYTLADVAYMGDDVLDVECMAPVKEAGGLTACPSDAVAFVKETSSYICNAPGGRGAVRELIDWLDRMRDSIWLNSVRGICPAAAAFMEQFNPSLSDDGEYDLGDGVFANVMTYLTVDPVLTCCEAHLRHIDVQLVIYGQELMVTAPSGVAARFSHSLYDEERDVVLYDCYFGDKRILGPGDGVVIPQGEAHRGAIRVGEMTQVRKIVIKVPVD